MKFKSESYDVFTALFLGVACQTHEWHPDVYVYVFVTACPFGFRVTSKIGSVFVRILVGLLLGGTWFWICRILDNSAHALFRGIRCAALGEVFAPQGARQPL